MTCSRAGSRVKTTVRLGLGLVVGGCGFFCATLTPAADSLLVVEQVNNTVTGEFASTYVQRFDDNLNSNNDKQLSYSMQANSQFNLGGYLWKYWFSRFTTTGRLVLKEELNSFSQNNSASTVRGETDSELTFFPGSRFPAKAFLSYSDTRNDADYQIDDYQMLEFGLQQDYRPRGSNARYTAKADRAFRYTDLSGDSRRDRVNLIALNSIGDNRFNGDIRYEMLDTKPVDEFVQDNFTEFAFFGQHRLDQGDSFSMLNTLDYLDTEDEFVAGDFVRKETTSQIGSNSRWRPWENHPLTVNASLRTILRDIENKIVGSDTDKIQSDLYYTRLGLDYRFANRTRLFSDLYWAQTNGDLLDHDRLAQRLGASYSSDSKPLVGFDYRWYGSEILSNEDDSIRGDIQRSDTTLGHSVDRNLAWGGISDIKLSVNQSLGYRDNTDPEEQAELTLMHSLSLTHYGVDDDRGANTLVRFTLDDVRLLGEYDENETTYQQATLQFTRNENLSNTQSLNSNLTVQVVADDDKERLDLVKWFYSGEVSYRHARLLGYYGLDLEVRLHVISNMLISARARGDDWDRVIDEDRFDQFNRDRSYLEARLTYHIGKLRARFRSRMDDINGHKTGMIIFDLRRYFDNR